MGDQRKGKETREMSKSFLMGLAVSIALVVGLVVNPFSVSTGTVSAHANLERSEPQPNSVIDQSPGRVTIWFTEPLEPDFSEIRVLDVRGVQVDNGDSSVDRTDPTVMSVTLPNLASGTYTVAWHNLSTVDGHTVRGSFVFSAGEPLFTTTLSSNEAEVSLFRSPLEPVLRWLILIGVLALFGGFGFDLLVSRPVLIGKDSNQFFRQLGQRVTSRIFKLIWIATGLVFVASIGQLIVQTALVFDVLVYRSIGSNLLSVLADTQWGKLWLWRVGLLLPLAVLVLFTGEKYDNRAEVTRTMGRWLSIWVTAGILLTLSLGSHGAATAEIQTAAIITDFLHLVAAGFWVGGLFHLALGLPLVLQITSHSQRRRVLAALLPRFSTIAGLSVGTLLITGLYSGWAQVTIIQAVATPYGFSLLAKLALVAVLLLLGGVNLIWVLPRLANEDRAAIWLRRLVVGEAVLALLVLLWVGIMTSLEPARQVASREGMGQENALTFQDTVAGADINLTIEPGRVGPNRFTVLLRDRLGKPVTNATDVALTLNYQDADLGETTPSARSLGDGKYVLDGQVLGIAGLWQVGIVVRRPNAFDSRTAFRFTAEAFGTGGSGSIAPNPITGRWLFGAELALLGTLFLAIGIPIGGWGNRAGAAIMGSGLLSAMVGIVLLFSGLGGAATSEELRNPFPPDPQSLAAGRQDYNENCMVCHGVTGRGDGPEAAQLDPPPLDLVLHVPLHADGDLFHFIQDGIPDTAMAGWGGKLTDEEIWHVINYIKTLEPALP